MRLVIMVAQCIIPADLVAHRIILADLVALALLEHNKVE